MPYTICPAQPVAQAGWPFRAWKRVRRPRNLLRMTGGSLAVILAGMAWTARGPVTLGSALPMFGTRSGNAPTSWLKGATLLTVYGRAFHTAPVLGQLGVARSFPNLVQRTASSRAQIQRETGPSTVRMAIHLIYGLATPCNEAESCLLYLDDAGVDVVRDYIEPAARHGWLVILDDQLGRSNPVREIERIREKGYLAYDNVEVAFDPEFRTAGDQVMPGVPPGQVTAGELNGAARVMAQVSATAHLLHRKLLLVHQWLPSMIRYRGMLAARRYVEPVLIMDAIGPADEKVGAYTRLVTNRLAARGILPGIKLFPTNPYDPSGHVDQPVLSWPQLLSHAPVPGIGGQQITIQPVPRVVVLT